MSIRLAFLALLALAACGVDGAPEPPDGAKPGVKGITITGDARFGVYGSR